VQEGRQLTIRQDAGMGSRPSTHFSFSHFAEPE
jgi:hypothetical protein